MLTDFFKETQRSAYSVCYEVDPALIYPATLEEIQQTLALAQGVPPALESYWLRAQQVPPPGWALAARAVATLDDEEQRVRVIILELTRLWFTTALRQRVPPDLMVELRILRDDAWKL